MFNYDTDYEIIISKTTEILDIDKYVILIDNKDMKIIRKFILFIIILIIIAILCLTFYGYIYYKQTINKEPLETKVNDIRSDFTYVKKEQLPEYYVNAVVAVEDRRYYSHGPVDYIGILRAIVSNIRQQSFEEGGSTITQQVAKNLYYINRENPVKRKVAECFTAIELEKKYSKDEILEMYVNIICFGSGYYGISEASEGYLKKKVEDINLGEAAMLAGIPNAPSAYSPRVNKDYCKSRTGKVLKSLLNNKYITQEQYDSVDLSFIDEIN